MTSETGSLFSFVSLGVLTAYDVKKGKRKLRINLQIAKLAAGNKIYVTGQSKSIS